MANRYSKALKHLKNKNIDEKLELLEQLPTNNTSGLYVDTPGTFEPEEIGPGDLPPNAGLNLDEDGQGQEGYTGNDTTGLFLADGTIKSVEPPGDTSYILGPMISMWYAWANYTQIGYVRQSDRKMVNLGRITGEMSAWDGETGFTGYGQLSIEQAVWYKGQTRADYRAFYPGPPSNPADQYGRYIGSMISSSKSTQTIIPQVDIPGINRSANATDTFSLQIHKLSNVAGLRPDGTQGPNRLGDVVPDHFGNPYKLVPRPGYGYNMWVPVKKAASDWNNVQVAAGGVPRNTGGKSSGDPNNIQWPRNNYPNKKAPPGPGVRKASYEPKGEVLTENRKRILRDIKKPVQVKEMPTKFKVKPTGRKNKSVGVDMMKIPDTPKQYKPPTNIWGKADYNSNVRASQEKKNEVLELLGAAEHHWTYLTEDKRKQKQEKVNEELSAEFDKQLELLYEKYKIKENKTSKVISYLKDSNLVYDKLDPQSAEAMPSTGDPTIDANVKKATNAKEKARKLKILLGKKD